VTHAVEVTAATLYEGVAQGLAAIRGNEWVSGIAQGMNVVEGVGGGRASEARSEADGIYEMAGKRWRISARDQGSSPDSFDIGDADVASELGREIKQAGSS